MKLGFWRKSDTRLPGGSLAAPVEYQCFLSLSPAYPVLDVARCEIESQGGESNVQHVLHVRVYDEESDKVAHFHLRIGVSRGRPWLEVAAQRGNGSKNLLKKAVAVWRDAALSSLGMIKRIHS